MEEKVIQKNTNLNLHPLIKEQPKFWQSCFDQEFKEGETIKKLQGAMNGEGSNNVAMLPEDSEDFLKEIFAVKSSLNNIKPNEDENPETFNTRKNSVVDDILINKVVPLIKQTFPVDEQFKEGDRQKLIDKLTSYPHRNYIPLLNLYLQFLVRNKFFENKEDKINLFSAFHNEIENCEGGMINRLYQYVGSNVIAQTIQNDLGQSISRFVEPGNQAHISGFIQRFIFGQESADPLAINVVKYVPLYALEKLCKEASNGDSTDRIFRQEIKSYLKTILTVSDAELEKRFGKDNGWKMLNYNLPDNIYGANIKSLLINFVNSISSIDNSSGEKVNDGDQSLFDLPKNIQEIISHDYKINSKSKREELINQNGGLDQVISKATEEIVDKIKTQTKKLPYAKNIIIDEKQKEKLDVVGELYFVFLRHNTYLTEKQFIDKLGLIKDLLDQKIEGGNTHFVLKDDINIMPEIKKYINNNLAELHLDQYNHVVLNQANSSLKNLVPQLQNNQDLIDSYLNKTLDNNQLIVSGGDIKHNRQLYVLSNNPLSCKDLNKKNLMITSDTIMDSAKLNMLHHYISPEQFIVLLGNNTINFVQFDNGNTNDLMLKFITNYGSLLIRNYPEKFIEILDSSIKEADIISKVLSSKSGQILAEKYPDDFIKILNKSDDKGIFQVLGGKSGQILAEKYPDQFFKTLHCIKDEDGINLLENQKESFFKILDNVKNIGSLKFFFESLVGDSLSLVDGGDKFLDISNKIIKKSPISEALNGKMGEILAERFPDQFIEAFDKRGKDEILKVLKLESGRILAERHPRGFIAALTDVLDSNKQIDNSDKIKPAILKDFVKSDAFKTLANNAAQNDVTNDIKTILEKISTKGVSVGFINDVDFIKDNNLTVKKPKPNPKPEKANSLGNKRKPNEKELDLGK